MTTYKDFVPIRYRHLTQVTKAQFYDVIDKLGDDDPMPWLIPYGDDYSLVNQWMNKYHKLVGADVSPNTDSCDTIYLIIPEINDFFQLTPKTFDIPTQGTW